MRASLWLAILLMIGITAAACEHARQPQWMSKSHHTYDDQEARDLHNCPHVGDLNGLC